MPIVGRRSSRLIRTAAARPARCGSGTVTIRNALMMRVRVARSVSVAFETPLMPW